MLISVLDTLFKKLKRRKVFIGIRKIVLLMVFFILSFDLHNKYFLHQCPKVLVSNTLHLFMYELNDPIKK